MQNGKRHEGSREIGKYLAGLKVVASCLGVSCEVVQKGQVVWARTVCG
jgi:hypothetical protein